MVLIKQLQSHDLFSIALPICLETLSVIENNDELLISLPEYGSETLNRIRGVLGQLNLRIDSDPYLFIDSSLNQLQADVNQINAYLQDPAQLVNDSSLNYLNNLLNSILAQMVYIPQISNPVELEGMRENVTSFRRSVARHKVVLEEIHQNIETKNNEITAEFEGLKTSFGELQEKINVASTDLEDRYSDIHESFLESENQRSNIFEQNSQEFRNTFELSLHEINGEWQQLLERNEEVLQATISTLNEEQESFKNDTLQKQREYDAILNEHKNSVENLVGIISTNTISGHFKEVADSKKSLTKIWQWVTVSGFAVTIIFGFFAFIFNENLDWPSLIARFIVTTALGSFTAYAARQVTKNETQEKYNRQMEIELKTLNPYIASFPDTEQIKLKEQLFPHVFGRAEIKNQEQNINTSRLSLNPQDLTILHNAMDVIKNITGGK